MQERKLQRQVVSYLKKVPSLWYSVINDRHTAGIPDILVCYRGKFVAIELKVGRNKPTALQMAQLQRIKHAGGIVTVAYNLSDVKEIIKNITH